MNALRRCTTILFAALVSYAWTDAVATPLVCAND
jgi:hypothetical protein